MASKNITDEGQLKLTAEQPDVRLVAQTDVLDHLPARSWSTSSSRIM